MNQKILFIRVTENCNANCFMCNFAGNKNGHIMSICEMSELIKELEKYDFKLIKFTGGEPLTNPYLKDFIKMLKNKKRNNINSFGCNNSSTFDTSRSEYKPSTRQ